MIIGHRTQRLLSILAVVAVLSQAPSARVHLQGARDNPLSAITGLRCQFTVATSALWKEGQPDVRTAPADSRLTISDIDIQDGTAEVSGPQGRRFATAVLSDGSLYFMETTRGALDVTTVFATESSPGALKAVRAQHAYVFLTVPPFDPNPTVSQSYGECAPVSGG